MADKKTALITGSYGGLGTCFVNIHASAGGNLILVGRSQTKLDEQKADTKLFANAVDPTKVAQAGYDGMIKGKLNVISGLPGWQTPMMKLAPLFPKKTMLNFVYNQQIAGSAKK